MKKQYEEDREIGSTWSWAAVVILCALILAWGVIIHAVVKDGAREWNYGTLPDAPSQSIYSTEAASEQAVPPRQVAPLPEAKPRKPAAQRADKSAPSEGEGRPPK